MKNKVLLFMLACISIFAFGAIGASAAMYGNLSYGVSNGTVGIVGCDPYATEIVIPEKIGGYPVVAITKGAFSDHNKITRIIIPDSVTSIGDEAFSGCTALTEIKLPDSITSIGNNVFENCSSLEDITIPDSVTSYGNYAFMNCGSLKNIAFPEGTTNIGNGVLFGCRSLKSITIPETVTDIGCEAFGSCSGLESIAIPENVKMIDWGAFLDCTGLKGVYITDLTAWCKINFGDYSANPLYCANNLYLNGELITDLTVPDGITEINEYAFISCTGLKRLTVSENVTGIGCCAFNLCKNLEKVTFSGNITNIGMYAFENCNSLTNITIPENMTSIAGRTFKDCSGLTSIVIPSGVTSIGCDVFKSCNLALALYCGTENEWNSIDIESGNENLTAANIVFNQSKKTYRFVTNCEYTLPDITDYMITSAPELQNNGKTFIGWYDNEALIGEPVEFPYYGDAAVLYAAWEDSTETKTVYITDTDGEKYTVEIPAGLSGDAQIILACYENGRLTEIKKELNQAETINLSSSKKFTSAKIMVWNNNMKPLCKAKPVE